MTKQRLEQLRAAKEAHYKAAAAWAKAAEKALIAAVEWRKKGEYFAKLYQKEKGKADDGVS